MKSKYSRVGSCGGKWWNINRRMTVTALKILHTNYIINWRLISTASAPTLKISSVPLVLLLIKPLDTLDKPFLPVFFNRNDFRLLLSESPLKRREEIIASRTSGLKNESVQKLLGGMDQNECIQQLHYRFLINDSSVRFRTMEMRFTTIV